MRTIIGIPEEQLKGLDYVCDKQNISRAEAIRRAIALYLQDMVGLKDDAAFGVWKSKSIDAVEWQKELRKEWE